jgi:phosphomethylpyrimidine synthase
VATLWGADTVMDLSTGKNIHDASDHPHNPPCRLAPYPSIRRSRRSAGVEDLTWDVYRDTLVEQRAGVDYFTVHAGVLLRYIPMTARRVTDRLARRTIIQRNCLAHHQESFTYTHFREICEIAPRRVVLARRRSAPRSIMTRTTRRSRGAQDTGRAESHRVE